MCIPLIQTKIYEFLQEQSIEILSPENISLVEELNSNKKLPV